MMEVEYRPSLSNLSLQMTLYFNALFSLIFAVVMLACAIEKVTNYEYNLQLQKYALLPIVVIWIVVEAIRVHYGMSGNLREKVPEMLTYLLISFFPQLPLVFYMSFFQEISFPIDPIIGVIMLVLLLLQFGLGFSTLRQLIRNQTAQFLRLCDREES